MRLIKEIPEGYNDHLPLLLEHFQHGEISLEEVAQILILWNDRGAFFPMTKTDTRLDFYYVDKKRRAEIEEELGRLYNFEQKSMK